MVRFFNWILRIKKNNLLENLEQYENNNNKIKSNEK
jgi:hypothetical protein